MRRLGYFFLLCGLLSSAAWGQSPRKNQQYVVIKCRAVSCGASASSATRRAKPEVKLGTFKSFPHSGLRSAKYEVKVGTFKPFPATSLHMVLLQAQLEKSENTGTLVVKTDAFPLPRFIVLR